MKIISTFIFSCILSNAIAQQPGDVNGTGLSFIPDFTFKGSALTNWKTIGTANWQARDGVLTGTVNNSSGLLVLDKSLQDVGIHTLVKNSADAEVGFLFRLEKTADSTKGVMVSVKNGEIVSYKISFDAAGKEMHREELRRAGSIVRLAPLPNPNAQPSNNNNANRNRRPLTNDLNMPLVRPVTAYKPNEWNQLEIFLDLNIIRSFLNDGGETAGGAADETTGRFGPIALYANGTGEVSIKDFGYKDLAVRSTPEEKTAGRFRVQRISDMYYSWSAASADFNKDGIMDIVAGPYIYFGPTYTSYREIFPGFPYNPYKDFTEVNCQYTYDFNSDGWPDVLTGPPRATLYINPKGESRRWDKYEVIPAVQSEITVLADIDKDGKPELIYAADGSLRFAKPDPADVTKPWIATIISERGYAMAHGIGTGDINGDGLIDIINPNGWWEQPKTSPIEKWIYHPQAFARYGHRSTGVGGSVMAIYDVNGDKLNDVVTSLNAHGFGLAWFEQQRSANGEISFTRHMISDDYSTKNAGNVTVSQLHGSTFADVDGDGVMDFIVGKRYWSHLDSYFDPDPYGAPVLYWYRTVRNAKAAGGAEFVPELVHNRSGAGSDVLAVDLNKDGAIDIVTSTDRGTFIFWNIGSRKAAHAKSQSK